MDGDPSESERARQARVPSAHLRDLYALAEEAIRHTEVVGFRIEHRPPEGPSRLLGETTMWATAAQSATAWARRLRLSGRAGTVVAVRAGSGEAVVERPIGPPRPPPGSLTPRQAEVLTLVCAGHADAEAAACLGLAPAGIRKFRWRIRHHLGVGSLAEACRRAETPRDETQAST